jgi:predicted transcriptional regulator of viral defense system
MREKTRTHHAIAELAANQHGVISAHQLSVLGFSDKAISRATTAGRLHRIHHSAYAVGHVALSRKGHCLAAVLGSGHRALLSHGSAAWLWGLTVRWREPIEVTASSPRQTRSTIRIHSASHLAAEDRGIFDGIPVTAIPRTLLDFAAVDPRFLGAALDRAEKQGLLELNEIEALLRRSKGFRGVARLRTSLEIYRTPTFTRSRLERRFLALAQAAGLPPPAMNLFIAGYELDAYWSAEKFAVELDTYDHHGGRSNFEADRLRQEDLKLAGIEMTRITGKRVDRDPDEVVFRLRRLLNQRRRQLGLAPFQSPG